uniref:Uncharacterized protein n=1 Tax=Astyanax mexicanus TaxID=7994 RepID=A0A3B1IH51_ASTMX
METCGDQLHQTLVRLRDHGVNLRLDNSEILDWYCTEGVKLKHKSKFRDLPAAIVWLLRRNDLKTIAEGEHAHIQSSTHIVYTDMLLILTSFTEDQPSQEIRNLRLQKNPKHAVYIYEGYYYAELLSSFTMYISTKCTVVVKNQVIKWDTLLGHMTLENTETLFTSCICCHETTSYILCTCNILKTFSQNNSRLISIQSSATKSQLLPRDHLGCFSLVNDTFYEENTCALTEKQWTRYRRNLGQGRLAEILPSSSTHSAQYTYTGWDWVFRGCVFASMVTFTVTLIHVLKYVDVSSVHSAKPHTSCQPLQPVQLHKRLQE